MPPLRPIAVSLAMVVLTGPVQAQGTGTSVVKKPAEIDFKPSPQAGGPETAVLYGNPGKPGLFVIRTRFPKGHKVTPRWRPDEWRTAVVLSGTFYYGIGEKWDDTQLIAYPPGTFFSHPPKHPHFAWAKDDDVVIQFTAMGPTAVNLIPAK